jgi:hypothetical protein
VPAVVPGCVVVTPHVVRSIKLCEALCVARAVLTPAWLAESLRAGALLPLAGGGYEPPLGDALRAARVAPPADALARRARATAPPLAGVAVLIVAGTKFGEDLARLAALLGATMIASAAAADAAAARGAARAVVAVASPDARAADLAKLRKAKCRVALVGVHWLTDTALGQVAVDAAVHALPA